MTATTLTAKELFDPGVPHRRVAGFRILARRVSRGGVHAEQRSRHHGLRHGVPRLPWLRRPATTCARSTGTSTADSAALFLRLFEEFEDLPVYIAPDISTSMFQTERPRAHAALRTAFALAAISLAHRDSVGLFPFSDKLDIALQPRSGTARLTRFAHVLAQQTPGGETDFVASLGRLARMNLRPACWS